MYELSFKAPASLTGGLKAVSRQECALTETKEINQRNAAWLVSKMYLRIPEISNQPPLLKHILVDEKAPRAITF